MLILNSVFGEVVGLKFAFRVFDTRPHELNSGMSVRNREEQNDWRVQKIPEDQRQKQERLH